MEGNPFFAGLAAAHRDRVVEVWSENVQVFQLFVEQRTQWNYHAMGAPVGLNYACAHRALDRMHLDDEELAQWESDLRTLEHAALVEMNKVKE